MSSSTTGTDRATGQPAEHLTDADLIRMLDGEPALSAVHDVRGHIATCDVCVARRELLSERRRRLAMLLTSTDIAVAAPSVPVELLLARARAPRPLHRRPAVRAAAVLLVAGTLAAQPAVRGWMSEQWRRVTDRTPPTASVSSPPSSSPAAPPAVAGTALTFESGPGPFTIVLEGRPSSGTLTIVSAEGTRASVERVSGVNLDLLVMPQGFRVRDAEGATASFVVRVPRSAGRVHVRFGESTSSREITVDLGDAERRIIDFERE